MSTVPNYHGDFYMPDHLHIQLDQEQPCHNLIGEGNKIDVASISIDSHEWEFHSPTYSTSDKEFDAIHTYDSSVNIGEGFSTRMSESDSPDIDLSFVASARTQRVSNTLSNEIARGLDLLVHAFDDYTMNALEPVTSLSLQHPELIDWNSSSPANEVLSFQNDNALACYLNAVKPVVSSTSESSVNMTEGDIKYLSRKIKQKKNKRSDGENHIVAVSEPKKVKKKGRI